jgi:membrane fusion protein, multidrug efflux system
LNFLTLKTTSKKHEVFNNQIKLFINQTSNNQTIMQVNIKSKIGAGYQSITVLLKGFALVSLSIIASAVFTSCGSNQPETDAEKIRTEISQHLDEINALTLKIGDLEQRLESLGEMPVSRSSTLVQLSEVGVEEFVHYFRVTGSVEAVREASISPEMSGQIKSIVVKRGQRVQPGDMLARLNTSVIETNIREVKTSLRLAKTVYDRQKGLWEQEIGSEIQYLEAQNNYESMQTRLETLEAQLDLAVMRAPFAGIVDDIFVKEGELAMPGMPVMQIISLSELYINADLAESLLPNVNSKDEVILRFPSFPDYEERIPIHRLGNVINPENRTFRLQLLINNREEKFKPNMLASISVNLFTAPDAIVVPSILIKQDVQGHYVFLAEQNEQGDWVARKRYVERGLEAEGRTMIASGIRKGEMLIQRGNNQVGDGSLLRIEQRPI